MNIFYERQFIVALRLSFTNTYFYINNF